MKRETWIAGGPWGNSTLSVVNWDTHSPNWKTRRARPSDAGYARLISFCCWRMKWQRRRKPPLRRSATTRPSPIQDITRMSRILDPLYGLWPKASRAPRSGDPAEGCKPCLFFANAQTSRRVLWPPRRRFAGPAIWSPIAADPAELPQAAERGRTNPGLVASRCGRARTWAARRSVRFCCTPDSRSVRPAQPTLPLPPGRGVRGGFARNRESSAYGQSSRLENCPP